MDCQDQRKVETSAFLKGLLALAAVLATSFVSGQQSSPLDKDRQAFGVEVNQVYLNAVVTDKAGEAVPDLKPEDFEIRENGRRQQITHFFPRESGCNVILLLEVGCLRARRLAIIKAECRRVLYRVGFEGGERRLPRSG